MSTPSKILVFIVGVLMLGMLGEDGSVLQQGAVIVAWAAIVVLVMWSVWVLTEWMTKG